MRIGIVGTGKKEDNAIEHAQLQSLGEGFRCPSESDFDLDLARIARLWRHGAVVRSWLLDLLGDAPDEEGNDLGEVGAYEAAS